MPGGPSSRGCDACRKQKKKCDQIEPTCSRCSRLGIPCLGTGQKRYLFKHEAGFARKPSSVVVFRSSEEEHLQRDRLVPRFPSNDLSLLTSAFLGTINKTTSMKYNLMWAYGGFLEDIPKRLGFNEALDTAVDALIEGHSSLYARHEPSIKAFTKYCHALQKLRVNLDNPVRACASETLGAVRLLMICQSFINPYGQHVITHCEGAAQIIKARRYYNVNDEFECKLFHSLRGSVLWAGVFSSRINFSPSEWRTLVQNKLDGTTPESEMMRCLAKLPDIMDRGRKLRRGDWKYSTLLHDARSNYQAMLAVVGELHDLLVAVKQPTENNTMRLSYLPLVYAQRNRFYGLGLSIAIMLNCVLRAIDTNESDLSKDSDKFSRDILDLSEAASMHRPLGAAYMELCLIAAWVGTTDYSVRSLVEIELSKYQTGLTRDGVFSRTALRQFQQHLNLGEPVKRTV